jgi:hypothetical protein
MPSMGLLPALGPNLWPRMRKISSLIQWAVCFLAYVSVLTTDEATRAQLAYACLILSEAQAHSGGGWLDYDRAFRQLRAANQSIPWESLDSGLYARLILSRRGGTNTFCTTCHAKDHTASECALAFTLQSAQSTSGSLPVNQGRRRGDLVCLSWNRESCFFPGSCNYRHVC